MSKLEPGHVYDWASKAAERIDDEYPHARRQDRPTVARIAAIIATYADPLIRLLMEAKKAHDHVADGDVRDGTCCPQCCCESWPDDPEGDFEPTPNRPDEPCACGADAWNARIDAALAGKETRQDRPGRAGRGRADGYHVRRTDAS